MAVPASTLLKRGLTRRCPICGQGGLFRRWLWMADRCPGCGLRFKRVPGHWLGSWFLNVLTAQAAIVAVLIGFGAWNWPHLPVVTMTVVAGAAALLVPVAFFPFSRMIWTAVELAMRPLEFAEGVAPGFELEADISHLDAERRRRQGRDGAAETAQ